MKHSPLIPRICHPSPLWLLLWLTWAITLWILSGGPPPVENDDISIPHIDKVLHFGYFFGGSGLLCEGLYLKKKPLSHPYLIVFALQALIGATDEIHQSFNPERSGLSWSDFAANLLGTAFGIFVFSRLKRLAFGEKQRAQT